MTHPLADILRFLIFALFGVGAGFMLTTNLIAYRVLRPPRRIGFLWWHVTAVSIAMFCFGVVAVDRVVGRIGQSLSWHALVLLFGCILFAASQVIIFRVERQRLAEKIARLRVDKAAAQGTSDRL